MPPYIIPQLQTVRTMLFAALQVIAFASLSSAAVLVPVRSTPTNHGSIISERSSQAITPQVSTLAQSLVDQGLVPGLTVGVVQLNGGVVLTEYGLWGNRTEDGDPAQSDTLFAIGSCSKAFTATAIGILMDDFASGQNVTSLPPGVTEFTYDTKMQQLFPGVEGWKLEDEWASQKANIRDLLSHVTGITRNEFMYTQEDTPLTIGPRFRFLRPGYELREQWSYTDIMYMFASQIVTTYSGMKFQDFVKERIFDPLNMTSTTYSVAVANASGLLSQSWAFNGRRIPISIGNPSSEDLIAGAGGILSNALDMTKWAATVLNGGVDPLSNKTIIPAAVYEQTTTSREIVTGNITDPSTSIVGYGLGWQRMSYFGHDVINHDGGVPGFDSTVMVLPGDNLAVISLLNTDAPFQDLIPQAIIQSVLGIESNDTESTATDIPPPSVANCTTPPSLSLDKFAGTYVSPGYGNLTFCSPTAPSGTNVTSYCASALSDFASISPNGTVAQDTLYAVTPRIVTHASMQRTCASPGGELFVLTLQSIYPQGFGRNTTAFSEGLPSVFPLIDVECVADGDGETVLGCGWLDSEPGDIVRTGTVQERANVWWDKI